MEAPDDIIPSAHHENQVHIHTHISQQAATQRLDDGAYRSLRT